MPRILIISALPLLVAGVGLADHIDITAAANDGTFGTDALDCSLDSHFI
jgi:hypothetical protein